MSPLLQHNYGVVIDRDSATSEFIYMVTKVCSLSKLSLITTVTLRLLLCE